MSVSSTARIHPSTTIEDSVSIGERTTVWHHCHLRSNSSLGNDVSLGKGVFIDLGVRVENGCRIQNGVSVYHGVSLGEWVFVGPNVTFTNDRFPRAGSKNWKVSETKLMNGCSIGAGSIINCDLTIGAFALVGSGSVVTEDIPAFHLAYGLPSRIISKICACGTSRLNFNSKPDQYLKECCLENLGEQSINLARAEIKKLL